MNLQVTACARCNSRKGQKTLEQANMKLRKIPRVSYVAFSNWIMIAATRLGCLWSAAMVIAELHCRRPRSTTLWLCPWQNLHSERSRGTMAPLKCGCSTFPVHLHDQEPPDPTGQQSQCILILYYAAHSQILQILSYWLCRSYHTDSEIHAHSVQSSVHGNSIREEIRIAVISWCRKQPNNSNLKQWQ